MHMIAFLIVAAAALVAIALKINWAVPNSINPSMIELADGETELTPQLNAVITIGTEDGADGIKTTIQLKDGQKDLDGVRMIRIWLSATSKGAPSAVTSEVVDTGTEAQEVLNHADYYILTDANGVAEITWTIAGAATRYCMVDFKGELFASSLITWAA